MIKLKYYYNVSPKGFTLSDVLYCGTMDFICGTEDKKL